MAELHQHRGVELPGVVSSGVDIEHDEGIKEPSTSDGKEDIGFEDVRLSEEMKLGNVEEDRKQLDDRKILEIGFQVNGIQKLDLTGSIASAKQNLSSLDTSGFLTVEGLNNAKETMPGHGDRLEHDDNVVQNTDTKIDNVALEVKSFEVTAKESKINDNSNEQLGNVNTSVKLDAIKIDSKNTEKKPMDDDNSNVDYIEDESTSGNMVAADSLSIGLEKYSKNSSLKMEDTLSKNRMESADSLEDVLKNPSSEVGGRSMEVNTIGLLGTSVNKSSHIETAMDETVNTFDESIVIPTRLIDSLIPRESIIMRSLGGLKKSNTLKDKHKKISPFTTKIQKVSKPKVSSASDLKVSEPIVLEAPHPASDLKVSVPEASTAPDYYLDYSLYADYYNDPVQDTEAVEENQSPSSKYKFRDYPMKGGYVRIPVHIPGLEFEGFSEAPRVWNAQEAFVEQVGSQLYMFVPSALLGFIIGLAVWVIALTIWRTAGLVKTSVVRWIKNEENDELDLKVKYTSEDPWKQISDAEKIHSVNGAIKKSVIGPCSPEKIAKFNQDMLDAVSKSPGLVQIQSFKRLGEDIGGQKKDDRDIKEEIEYKEALDSDGQEKHGVARLFGQ